ncbi:hypothetical protein K0A97_00375 [Patescibacteria group bacterium]|nr:hypothetical protein [Patescibacteria group bacterium]
MVKINEDYKSSKNSRSSFWQAFILTVLVFVGGILFGMFYEGNRFDKISDYYVNSEVFLMDSFALTEITDLGLTEGINCEILINVNVEFADKIYSEALLLEKYDESQQLAKTLDLMHMKYDLLRTLLWINTLKIPQECTREKSVLIYLFERKSEDLTKKATNTVWSRILFDLKQEMGNELILIPIGVDSDITSLNTMLSRFEISEYPALVINEEEVLTEIQSVEELKNHLK